jgi:hypothetical protein
MTMSVSATQHNNALPCAECRYADCRYAECHCAEWHYDECHYAECHYAECHYAECHYADCRGAIKCFFYIFLKSLHKKIFLRQKLLLL